MQPRTDASEVPVEITRGCRRCTGRLFQNLGPAAAMERSSRHGLSGRSSVCWLWLLTIAAGFWFWVGSSPTNKTMQKPCTAVLWTQTASFETTRCLTGSQWSCLKTCVIMISSSHTGNQTRCSVLSDLSLSEQVADDAVLKCLHFNKCTKTGILDIA